MKFNLDDLNPLVQKWSRRLGVNVRRFAPKHLRSGVIYTKSKVEGQDFGVRVWLKEPEEGDREKGDAYGRELGAGLYGLRKRTYKIYPKEKKVLAFYWDKVDKRELGQKSGLWLGINGGKFAGYLEDGRLMFNWVDHPGYMAANNGEGYVRPGFNQTLDEINKDKEMSKKMKKIIMDGFEKHIRATAGEIKVEIR